MVVFERKRRRGVGGTRSRLQAIWLPSTAALFAICMIYGTKYVFEPAHRRDAIQSRQLLSTASASKNISDLGYDPADYPPGKCPLVMGSHAISLWTSITGDQNCVTDFDRNGGPAVLILVILYSFLGLAIICDDYFVESLEKISTRLGLSDDVAGATFMAAGSSAPELMTSTVTTLVTHSVGGVGAIVGSAIFNILCIVGLTAFLAGQKLKIAWYPLCRDTVFYAFSVGVMSIVVSDSVVYWYEGLVMVATYAVYIVFMYKNQQIGDAVTAFFEKKSNTVQPTDTASITSGVEPLNSKGDSDNSIDKVGDEVRRAASMSMSEKSHSNENMVGRDKSFTDTTTATTANGGSCGSPTPATIAGDAAKMSPKTSEKEILPGKTDEVEEAEAPKPMWKKILGGLWGAFCFPLEILMKFTVPNCGEHKWAQWYPLTFTMSIVWIAIFTYAMVDSAERLGRCIGVSDFFMGLLVLAAGTSVPDALSSILVARNGQGDMAVSNALGSNVFDILLGLGLPWFIQGLLQLDGIKIAQGCPTADPNAVFVNWELVTNIIVLVLSLCAFVGTLVAFKWWLSPKLGLTLAGLYLIYVIWTILTGLELDGLDPDYPKFRRPVILIG